MYIENISAKELRQYIYDRKYEIIDLRDLAEYKQAHVVNSVHIASGDIFSEHLEKITKKNVILYCDRGGESIRIARILASKGYDVKNVIGGFYEIRIYADILA